MILALLFSALTVVSLETPARASDLYWGPLKNYNAGKCAFAYERWERVLLNWCKYGGMDQAEWRLHKVGRTKWGDAKIIMRNRHSGLCLMPGTKSKGAYVYTGYCTYRDGRVNVMAKWVVQGTSTGTSRMRKTGTSNCLGIDGTWRGARLRLWDCKPDAPYQKWQHNRFAGI